MSTNTILHGRQFREFEWTASPETKSQMLNWANRFNICCFMDNHGYREGLHGFECLLAAGAWKKIAEPAGHALESLQGFLQAEGDWLFGHLGFGLKAETMQSYSSLPDPVGFPDLCFFIPEYLLLIKENKLWISSYGLDPAHVLQQLQKESISAHSLFSPVELKPAFSAQEYISRVEALKAHIHRGDCYEINFCQEFRAADVELDPVKVFKELVSVSPNPFSVFYKWEKRYLLCASPERFFRLEGKNVWSQPIKGTSPRYPANPEQDRLSAKELVASEKERSENVMVVDLVRNDLSRVCVPGSVKVDELFGVYSFPQVHQLVSTISGELQEGKGIVDLIRACFPMGSMTGAPKKRVLELIEQYEILQRGLYSGAVGYITPDGIADFNV
ncbi:MAG: hypothetical protein A1D16_13355, partial [Flavihumibacter sp. CACIAM 22H1]